MGASSNDQYCLRWNDFQANITTAFSDIRDEEDFLDVTLVADGQTARAHKLVLSACSPLFKSMLKKNTHAAPMIFLHGIRYGDIVAILNFMYQGEVNVNQEDLQTFLAAAEELHVRGLSDRNSTEQTAVAALEQHTISPAKQPQLPRQSGSSSPKSHSSPVVVPTRNVRSSPSSIQSQEHQVAKRPRVSSGLAGDADKRVKRGVGSPVHHADDSSSQDDDVMAYDGFGGYDPALFGGGSTGNSANLAAAALMAEEMSSPAAAAAAGQVGERASSLWFQHQSAALMLEQRQQQYLQQQLAQQQQQQQQQQLRDDPSAAAGRPVCQFCRKELKNLHSLNVHISRYHSETNDNCVEVICPVCERTYGNKYSLRTHMHLNHKDQLHLLGTAKKSTGAKKSVGAAGTSEDNDNEDRDEGSEVETAKEEPYFYG